MWQIWCIPILLNSCRDEESESETKTLVHEDTKEFNLAVLGYSGDPQVEDCLGKEIGDNTIAEEDDQNWIDHPEPEVLHLYLCPFLAEQPVTKALELDLIKVMACVLFEVLAIATDLSKLLEVRDALASLLLLQLPVLGNRMILELYHRGPVPKL